MGRMRPFIEGLRKNRLEEGIPYVVGVYVHWGMLRVGKRRVCNWQVWRWKVSEYALGLEANDLELFGCVMEGRREKILRGGGRF